MDYYEGEKVDMLLEELVKYDMNTTELIQLAMMYGAEEGGYIAERMLVRRLEELLEQFKSEDQSPVWNLGGLNPISHGYVYTPDDVDDTVEYVTAGATICDSSKCGCKKEED